MDEQYLVATVRYGENNPVAARLCAGADQRRWSSAKADMEGRDDALVRAEPMLSRVARWENYLTGTDSPEATPELIERHYERADHWAVQSS